MQLLTAEQVSKKLQVSKLRVYELARLGIIPCVHLGRQVRFDEQALIDWVASGGCVVNEGNEECRENL